MAITITSSSVVWPSTISQTNAGIGYGQSWQNVSGSRSVNTTYTNSTGRPIMILFTPNASANCYGSCLVDGITVGYQQFTPSGGGGCALFSFIVPNSSTYAIVPASNFSTLYWYELR